MDNIYWRRLINRSHKPILDEKTVVMSAF